MGSVEVVERLLARIAEVDSKVNAICTLNPRVLAQAAALDAERAAGRVRGPLHGLPILLKDNLDTADLPTTAGSVVLAGLAPPRQNAVVVQRLLDAGCVVIGKTNMSEWARMRGPAMVAGLSGYGGQTRNPYALDYSPGGSSSGSAAAVAARLAPIAIGTETNGSIIGPASLNGVVGLKPTVGLLPQDGLVPLARSQDTAGPMALSVRAAAEILTAMRAGTGNYAANCEPAAATDLTGLRIGVPRGELWGHDPEVDQVTEAGLGLLAAAGATVVDTVELPALPEQDEAFTVLRHEFKQDIEAYLRTRPDAPRTLVELIELERRISDTTEYLERAASSGGLDAPDYLSARATVLRIGRDGIDDLLRQHELDLMVMPVRGPAWVIDPDRGDVPAPGTTSHAAFAGYPMVSVPSGMVGGLPVGIGFTGTAYSEGTLIRVAHAFEQARTAAYGAFPEPALRRRPELTADRSSAREIARLAFEGQSVAGKHSSASPGPAGRPKPGPPGVELS